MTEEHLNLLRTHIDRDVKIVCTDGEVLIAKLLLISEEDRDAIYDVATTNKPEHYKSPGAAYLIHFDEIESVEPLTDDRRPTTDDR